MAAPSTFTPGLVRPFAKVGNGLLRGAGRTGHLVEFFFKVVLSMPKEGKVVVSGVNVAARHRKPTQMNPQGGIERREAPMAISKVGLAVDGKPSRVRFETKNGKKVRVAVKSGETIDG